MFTKELMHYYLGVLSTRLTSAPVEIWVVNDAAIVLQFGFKESCSCIDVIKDVELDIRGFVFDIGQEHALPNGWLRDYAMFSNMFSRSLRKYIGDTVVFNNVLTCHYLSPVAIVATLLRANIPKKEAVRDAICVFIEADLTVEQVVNCFSNLYLSGLPLYLADLLVVVREHFNVNTHENKYSEIDRLFKVYGDNVQTMAGRISADLL